jgi:hypothetical protein
VFVFIWPNEISIKAACKILVKLTADCNRVIYEKDISIQPFRMCDEKNFGMSDLCTLQASDIRPQIWGKQILDQLSASTKINITQVNTIVKSNQRLLTMKDINQPLFNNISRWQ